MDAKSEIKEVLIEAVVTRGPSGELGPPGSQEDKGVISRSEDGKSFKRLLSKLKEKR